MGMNNEISPFEGISVGALRNFAGGGGFYDPKTQGEKDVKDNLVRLSEYMSNPNFNFVSVSDKLESLGFDKNRMAELSERAYLVSDAFKERAVRSLGYDKLEDMTPEHRTQYDKIVGRAENSVGHLFVRERSGNSSFIDPEKTLELINADLEKYKDNPAKVENLTNLKEKLMNVLEGREVRTGDGYAVYDPDILFRGVPNAVVHEMSHYVYNKEDINPGVHGNVNSYAGERTPMGKENSPLNEIDRDKIILTADYVRDAYRFSPEKLALIVNGFTKESLQFIKNRDIHDNTGYERAADIHAIRVEMFLNGKFNMFDSKSQITPEMVDELQKEHPYWRIFQHWENDKARDFLNDIAENGSLNKIAGDNLMAALNEGKGDGQKMPDGHISTSQVNIPALTAANYYQDKYKDYVGNEKQEHRGLSV